MPDHDVRGDRAFYDHETEDSRLDGRGRRSVADWGVNEELFDRMPARRRFRPSEAAPRRDAHPRERREPAEPVERTPDDATSTREPRERAFERAEPREWSVDGAEPRERAEPPGGSAGRERRQRAESTPENRARMAEDYERFTLADEPAPVAVREPAPTAPGPAAAEVDIAPRAELDTVAHPAEGRRTVVIRGRGAEPSRPSRRERPPRTVGERLGPRPDRLAAWAVALGVLLILIAILTAHG